MTKTIATLALLVLGLAGRTAAAQDGAPEPSAPTTDSRPAWSEEIVDLFATLPAQDGGRVKPLDTVAGFRLLKMNIKRSVPLPGGEPRKWWQPWKRKHKLTPTAWLLDCLFYPEIARTYRVFYVRDVEVLEGTGVDVEGRKRTDRYSYDELLPARAKIFSAASRAFDKEAKTRTRIEAQSLALADAMSDFEALAGALDFARMTFVVDRSEGLKRIFGGAHEASFADVLAKGPELRALAQAAHAPGAVDADGDGDAVMALLGELQDVADAGGHAFAIVAPQEPTSEAPEWSTPTEIAFPAIMGTAAVDRQLAAIQAFSDLVELRDQRDAFTDRARDLHQTLVGLAEARGEYGKIPLEVRFYRLNLFTRALAFFLLAFLACAAAWLFPRSRALPWVQWGTLAAGTALVVLGIVMRCIIRERPPISTLYETILFISGTAVISAMAIEAVSRQRVALGLAPLLGALGMFLSMKYELKEASTSGDTMPSLVAVLDTNFWLATHVTVINLGYMAGLLGAALGHVWILGKVLGVRRNDGRFYREVTRMTYGVQCFGLLFALVGTILGGIWANYSWGRFWGWDPKENGALLIVLWMLVILHGRLGGYLRDFGIALASVFGGMVVAFSWWGVNFLGIGLHSYGFTEGVMNVLLGFWVVEAVVMGLGIAWWALARRASATRAEIVEPSGGEAVTRA